MYFYTSHTTIRLTFLYEKTTVFCGSSAMFLSSYKYKAKNDGKYFIEEFINKMKNYKAPCISKIVNVVFNK